MAPGDGWVGGRGGRRAAGVRVSAVGAPRPRNSSSARPTSRWLALFASPQCASTVSPRPRLSHWSLAALRRVFPTSSPPTVDSSFLANPRQHSLSETKTGKQTSPIMATDVFSVSETSFEAKVPARRGGRMKRTYRCRHCARIFKRSEHCARHERVHTQEKPFPCAFCDRRYARKYAPQLRR